MLRVLVHLERTTLDATREVEQGGNARAEQPGVAALLDPLSAMGRGPMVSSEYLPSPTAMSFSRESVSSSTCRISSSRGASFVLTTFPGAASKPRRTALALLSVSYMGQFSSVRRRSRRVFGVRRGAVVCIPDDSGHQWGHAGLLCAARL
jgi:hypothetical protein